MGNERYVYLDNFREVLLSYGCVFNNYETKALFNLYDQNGDKRLSYEEIENLMNLTRKK